MNLRHSAIALRLCQLACALAYTRLAVVHAERRPFQKNLGEVAASYKAAAAAAVCHMQHWSNHDVLRQLHTCFVLF